MEVSGVTHRRIRIGIIDRTFESNEFVNTKGHGTISTTVANYVKLLPQEAPELEFTIFSQLAENRSALPKNITIIRVPGTYLPGSIASSIVFKLQILRLLKILVTLDVVETWWHMADGFPVVVARKIFGRPRTVLRSVAELRDSEIPLFSNCVPEHGIKCRLRFLLLKAQFRLANITLRLADVGTFESYSSFRRAPRTKGTKYVVNQNGIDDEIFKKSPSTQAVLKFGLSPGQFALFVGALEPRKGLDLFFQATSKLVLSGKISQLVVVGAERRQGYRAEVLRDVDSKVVASTKFLTGLTTGELSSIYSACRLLVCCSRYESFGFPVVEALACGSPVVSTPTGVAEELDLVPPLGIRTGSFSSQDIEKGIEEILGVHDTDNYAMRRRALVVPNYTARANARRAIELFKSLSRTK